MFYIISNNSQSVSVLELSTVRHCERSAAIQKGDGSPRFEYKPRDDIFTLVNREWLPQSVFTTGLELVYYGNMYNSPLFFVSQGMKPVIYLLVVLDLILKGISLYKSARKDQRVWFVALLLINSLGILPIIYLLVNKDVQLVKTSVSPKKTAKKVAKSGKR